MSPTPTPPWKPDPELLAAYADGELTAAERARVDAYLAEHPEAQHEVEAQRRLKALWDRTAPVTPDNPTWQRVLARLDAAPPAPGLPAVPRAAAWAASLLAVVIGLAWAWLLAGGGRPPAPAPVAVLPVAAADEVDVLHVEGEDVASVVVGRLPLEGVLELAEPGEVEVTSMQPDRRDNMTPTILPSGRRPMIWARLDSEDE